MDFELRRLIAATLPERRSENQQRKMKYLARGSMQGPKSLDEFTADQRLHNGCSRDQITTMGSEILSAMNHAGTEINKESNVVNLYVEVHHRFLKPPVNPPLQCLNASL